jgi:hypothetical protein
MLAIFVVASALGCQSEVDPEAISASVVAYGEFEIRGGLPILIAKDATIPCEQGRLFGVDYRIDVANGEYGVLPIEFRWTHPDLAVPESRLWGTESEARRPNPSLAWRQSSLTGRALWRFDHPDEMVSGRFEFLIRRRDDGSVLLSQSFDIHGC